MPHNKLHTRMMTLGMWGRGIEGAAGCSIGGSYIYINPLLKLSCYAWVECWQIFNVVKISLCLRLYLRPNCESFVHSPIPPIISSQTPVLLALLSVRCFWGLESEPAFACVQHRKNLIFQLFTTFACEFCGNFINIFRFFAFAYFVCKKTCHHQNIIPPRVNEIPMSPLVSLSPVRLLASAETQSNRSRGKRENGKGKREEGSGKRKRQQHHKWGSIMGKATSRVVDLYHLS